MIIVKQKSNGVWVVVHEDWDGTGARERILKPGRSVEFVLTAGGTGLDLDPNLTMVGVHIRESLEGVFTSVWSAEINLKDLG